MIPPDAGESGRGAEARAPSPRAAPRSQRRAPTCQRHQRVVETLVLNRFAPVRPALSSKCSPQVISISRSADPGSESTPAEDAAVAGFSSHVIDHLGAGLLLGALHLSRGQVGAHLELETGEIGSRLAVGIGARKQRSTK